MSANRSTNTRAIGVSVVMAVYKNDRASWVRQAIDSVLDQTLQPDEVIVVVDGEIPKGIQKVLDSYSGGGVKQIPLDENRGLWNALNVGIAAAKHELIARMDADDIALPQRFEEQVAEFMKDKELDVLGGQIDEFSGKVTQIIGRRIVPEDHDSIVKFARRRSPFNHPTVMYKKKAVMAAGGYRERLRSEDYDLWVRMLKHGCKAKNLNKTLLMFRVNNAGVDRRKNWKTVIDQIKTRKILHKEGYLGLWDLVVTSTAYIVMAFSPTAIAGLLYKSVLRRHGYVKD